MPANFGCSPRHSCVGAIDVMSARDSSWSTNAVPMDLRSPPYRSGGHTDSLPGWPHGNPVDIGIVHGYSTWTLNMDTQHGYSIYTHHLHGYFTWTSAGSTWIFDMDALQGHSTWRLYMILYMDIPWIYTAAEGGPSLRDVERWPQMADASRPNHMSRLRPGVGGRGVERGTERVSAQDCLQLGCWMWMEYGMRIDAPWTSHIGCGDGRMLGGRGAIRRRGLRSSTATAHSGLGHPTAERPSSTLPSMPGAICRGRWWQHTPARRAGKCAKKWPSEA
jgi:hypothetical protein